MRRTSILLGLLLAASAGAQSTDGDWTGDEAVLKSMGLPTKGAALLKILRDRTPKPDTVSEFNKHVPHLSASTFAERNKANADLIKMGPVIRPLLERLLLDSKLELETKRRLQAILEQFPAEKDINAVSAAAHLLNRDKPDGRLTVLLDYVPHATNENVRQEVQRAIDDAALGNGEPAALITAGLKDEDPARRAAAGEALVRAVGPKKAMKAIEPLLKDAHPLVRYQLGLALVEKHALAGVPLLIQTITDGPSERVEFALELLYRVAGEKAPTEYYQGKKNAAAVAAKWQDWFDKNETSIDLSKLTERQNFGYTVITMVPLKVNAKSKIYEIGPRPQAAVRWEFEGPRSPFDVQILGPNRLLLAEYSDRAVTERDFKGNVIKQFPANLPIGCQRLPNGNTFIVTRQLVQIVDPEGTEVFAWKPQPNPLIMYAQWQRNGQIVVLSTGGLCQLLDSQGKELKRFTVPGTAAVVGSNIEVLPNGRVLIPLYTQQAIAEYDWTGKNLWQVPAPRPLSVSRLPNGNTLVTTVLQPYRIVEIDREGREVWTLQTDGRPYRARGR
jgi:hypothetical protein